MQPPDERDTNLPSTIALVGASIRAASQSARRGGFSVLGADLFGDLDTLEACDYHELLDRSRQNELFAKHFTNPPITTNLPIIRVGGLGNVRLDCEFRSLGPSLATIGELKNPTVLGRLAAESGMRVPKTFFGDAASVSASESERWLKKNTYSSGGTGVTWYAGPSGRNRTAPRGDALFPSHAMLQQWVAGRNYGATFFADSDSVSLLGIFRSLFVRRGQHPFLYAGSFGPVPIPPTAKNSNDLPSLQPALHRFGKIASEHFQLRGLFNIDFIVDESGNGWVLEINPRWTAASELIERRLIELGAIEETDSLMRWHLLAHLKPSGWRLKTDMERRVAGEPEDREATWFKQVIYTDRPGMLDMRSLQTITNRPALEFADLPPPNRIHRRGDPLLTMIGKLGPDRCRMPEKHGPPPLSPPQWRQAIRETLRMIH